MTECTLHFNRKYVTYEDENTIHIRVDSLEDFLRGAMAFLSDPSKNVGVKEVTDGDK